jgi:hypothetical protein
LLKTPASLNAAIHCDDIVDLFRIPMTRQAFNELQLLSSELSAFSANSNENDSWSFIWNSSTYSVKKFYRQQFLSLQPPKPLRWIWQSKCMPKIKFFAWLLLNDRLNTRNILRSHNKHLKEGYNCVLCHENVEETAYHLFFDCSAAATRWFSIGITWDDSMDICQKIVVDIGCGPNHTPERALNAQAATDQRTQRRCHSYVVKHGVVYKQTTKG